MVIRLVTYVLLVNGLMILRLVEGVDVGDRLERCLGRGWAFMLEQLYHMQIIKTLSLYAVSVIISDDMVQVTRKDQKEANENIIRRFNRRVLQSGVLANAKSMMRFEKPISKSERRKKAIIRRERRADKTAKMRLGVR